MLEHAEALDRKPAPSSAVCLLPFVQRSLSLAALVFFICNLIGIPFLHSVKVFAQDPKTVDDVVSVSTDLLLFPIRIKDKRGQTVQGLKESTLSLEDKDGVISGLYFAPGADRVALVFALDQSGSLREIISQQHDAALALFGRFSDRSSIAVLRFAAVPAVVAAFNRDYAEANTAFSFLASNNQPTAIFDAAAKAVTMFEALPTVRTERRIVILFSDGLDNASHTKPGAVIDAALNKRVSFYVIHLPLFEPRDGRLAVRQPSRGFRELAEKTGGKYFLVGDARAALAPRADKANDLTPVFQTIEDDLKSQYLLGFYAGEVSRDGRKHRFSLSMPPGVEYQVPGFGYSRTHEFFVMPHGTQKVFR